MKFLYNLDATAFAKAAFGLIILQVDEVAENELRGVFNAPGIALYHSRVPSSKDVSTASLNRMKDDLPRAISLLPDGRDLDVVAYACTSGATVIGSENIAAMVRARFPDCKVSDPMSAVIAALRHLGRTRIGLITPYVPEVSLRMCQHLESNGFEINGFGSFEQSDEATVARIDAPSILNAISKIGAADDVDAVFLSCTNLRSFDIIEQGENLIGKPVISSSQALAWHMLKLARLETQAKGPGRLFSAG